MNHMNQEFMRKQFAESAHVQDWPEDFAYDNGMYMNTCKSCGIVFTGHKRRCICKLCSDNTIDMQRETKIMTELVWYHDQGLCKKVLHKKTGNIYYVIGEPRINCTNGNEEQIMIQYAMPSMAKIFVREQKEFWEKFELV